MNCFGFGDGNNCYLWILILILLFCCKGCNVIDNVCGLLSGCGGAILPIALALLLCCCCKDKETPRYGCK